VVGNTVDLVESSVTNGRAANPMTSTDRTRARVPAGIASVERERLDRHFLPLWARVRKRAGLPSESMRTSAHASRPGAWRRGNRPHCRGSLEENHL
jgi:hypothetical protein